MSRATIAMLDGRGRAILFNSLSFAVFLPTVYLLYRIMNFRAQNLMLLVASYMFYGWWDWRFLFLMIVSTVIDFWTGLILDRAKLTRTQIWLPISFLVIGGLLLVGFDFSALIRFMVGQPVEGSIVSPNMPAVLLYLPLGLGTIALIFRWLTTLDDARRRKYSMILSMITNLAILGFFKYFNFFIDSLVVAFNSVGIAAEPRHFDIVLPVGISFYTFQSMSYAIDIYRRELKPSERFLDFALFVSFFPQLVAGPIERAQHLLPQISNARILTFEMTTRGLFLILFGLFKKMAIADGVAPTVDQIFGSTGTITFADAAVGTVLFAIQIYCDFSGYSDIARGTAKLFGIDIMVNFRQPYFALSPREFWQRWHVSLSTWLGDYLYRPLGGNKGGLWFTCRNLMLTMLLGGLWHGAAWNFILWGFYNGALICIQRILFQWRGKRVIAITALSFTLMFIGNGLLTLYGRMLFRAESLDQILTFTTVLATGAGGLNYGGTLPKLSAVLGVLLLTGWEIVQYRNAGDARFYQSKPKVIVALAIAMMILLTFMGMSNEPAVFIYFQF